MKNQENSMSLLLKHCKEFPEMQIQDVFKFLYQSTFGCEHFVASLNKTTDMIKEEYKLIKGGKATGIVALDGQYSRVPLSVLDSGISAETFGKLFAASSKKEKGDLSVLSEKLMQVRKLIREGALPFDEKDFEEAAERWKSEGFPAVHHSEIFRREYNPSYRVIANEYLPFIPLLARIDSFGGEKRTVIAVDGGGASGKTTLSGLLEELYCCTVFHTDDFFLRPFQRTQERLDEIGGNIDRERFISEVLEPLIAGKDINYVRFDCSAMSLENGRLISPERLVIVEGAYSMHPALEGYYDFSVFLDVSENLQRERIMKRNSSQLAERFFSEWIPMENRYFRHTDIRRRCDMIIDIK